MSRMPFLPSFLPSLSPSLTASRSQCSQPLTECISDPAEQKQGAGGRGGSWHDPRIKIRKYLGFFLPRPPHPLPLSRFFLWLMGRSPSVRRLGDKLHFVCRARLLSHSTSLSPLCISAIKRFGSDQALVEPRDFQPGDVSDHAIHSTELPPAERFHSLRPLYVLFPPSVSGARVSPPPPFCNWLLTWTSGIPPITDLFLHQRGERDAENQRLFALNLSGSGNPEYAIHRVVEPEIDHIES
jgi:hypothetical protein